jgi:hypothetical protein
MIPLKNLIVINLTTKDNNKSLPAKEESEKSEIKLLSDLQHQRRDGKMELEASLQKKKLISHLLMMR